MWEEFESIRSIGKINFQNIFCNPKNQKIDNSKTRKIGIPKIEKQQKNG